MGSRQRVSVACQTCRGRRAKCDGAKPRCSRCVAFQETCEYRYSEEKRKPPSKRYVQSLLSRIDNLERQLAKYEGGDGNASPGIESPQGSTTPPQQGCDWADASAGHDPVREVVDLCGGLSVGEGQELRFFDTRSSLAMVGEQLDERCYRHLLKFSADRSQRPGIDEVDVAEAVQDALLAKFWTWQNSWQYIVHEGAWNRSREAQDNEYCTLVLLYAILAVAARYSDEPDGHGSAYDPTTAGTVFSSRAKQLIFEEIEAPRLPTVIAAALISVVEMSLDIEPAGWTYLGIAVRMAYTLGLHTDPRQWVQSGRLTAEEAEIRSIAWWGCYTIDKFYSTALGRPSACNERDIRTPLPAIIPEVEYRNFQGSWPSQPENDTPISYSITNFRHTCNMLRLTAGPLDDIYSPGFNSNLEHRTATALKVAVELSAFYDKVPSVIRLPSFASGQPVAAHIYYFHIHYHCINILIHRPFISAQAAPSTPGTRIGTAGQNLSECIRSAETLTLILREIEKYYSLRTAPLSIIHPTLTAGIIHLVNLTLPNEAVKEKAKIYLLHVVRSLKQMSTAWVWALRAIRVLKLVARRWLPQERADSIGRALTDVFYGEAPEQQASPDLAPLPELRDNGQLWDELLRSQNLDASWLGADFSWPELSFFNLDQ